MDWSSLLLFHRIYCGAVSIKNDKPQFENDNVILCRIALGIHLSQHMRLMNQAIAHIRYKIDNFANWILVATQGRFCFFV